MLLHGFHAALPIGEQKPLPLQENKICADSPACLGERDGEREQKERKWVLPSCPPRMQLNAGNWTAKEKEASFSFDSYADNSDSSKQLKVRESLF